MLNIITKPNHYHNYYCYCYYRLDVPYGHLFYQCFTFFKIFINFKDFCDIDQCRKLEFTPEKAFDGRRLINHVIGIVEVLTMNFCENMLTKNGEAARGLGCFLNSRLRCFYSRLVHYTMLTMQATRTRVTKNVVYFLFHM